MEIERLKALKMYEERERRRAEANRLGSMVSALHSDWRRRVARALARCATRLRPLLPASSR